MKPMSRLLNEELQALQENMEIVANKIANAELSTAGMATAEKILNLLTQIKMFLVNKNSEPARVGLIIEKMPLLYLQITKLN